MDVVGLSKFGFDLMTFSEKGSQLGCLFIQVYSMVSGFLGHSKLLEGVLSIEKLFLCF